MLFPPECIVTEAASNIFLNVGITVMLIEWDILQTKSQITIVQGVPKRTHFQNAAGAAVHWLNHHSLVSGD